MESASGAPPWWPLREASKLQYFPEHADCLHAIIPNLGKHAVHFPESGNRLAHRFYSVRGEVFLALEVDHPTISSGSDHSLSFVDVFSDTGSRAATRSCLGRFSIQLLMMSITSFSDVSFGRWRTKRTSFQLSSSSPA